MLSKNVRGLLLFSILILLIIIPISFAQDSDALILDEQSGDDFIPILTDGNEISNSSYDYYFDASVESDGNGSLESPYKYLTDARIKDNSVIHLASGQYDFAPSKTHSNVSIYGENSLINGNGKSLITDKYFSLNNITLVNLPIENRATFIASNVVFANSTGKAPDSYGNSYGGAIYCTYNVASIALDNCIFENTSAAYGGAIYAVGCSLDVRNCVFYNCTSHNFGGAISCKSTKNIVISRSKFNRCYSNVDAGGALNIVSSKIRGTDLEFIGCNATLGGAITSLSCEVYLDGINFFNNSAINGGALYHMYGNFTLTNSVFINNSAINGGASFIDNSQALLIKNNYFINNTASYCAGGILSILNEFIEPLNNTFLGNSAQIMDDEFISSDIIITIGSGNYTMFKLNSTSYDQLPARYSLVDEGYSTSVKNQDSGGNCWAYATIAVLESCILKALNVTYDLSEGNMKNLMALYSDYGWNINPNDGGNNWMTWGYLTSWLGPVNESDDESDDISFVSPVLNSILHVQNILYLYRDNYTDNDAVKEAILNYGAVWSSMSMYGSYLKYSSNAYYCYSNEQLNHAVTIVGWDDNYSKSNFAKTPPGDGAWIVKNSWGDNWGDKGYFYVSYYDTGLARPKQTEDMHTFILNDTIRYDRNYQYDISGKTDYFLNSTSTVWYKNVFTAIGDEYLAAVSTYFEKITNWTITVNVNNEFSTSKSGTSNLGYFTIELDDFVPLKAGDVFEVIFKITVDGDAGIPISEIYNFNNMAYSENVSYASWDGLNWKDLFDLEFEYSNHWYASQAACLKAFTFINIINTTLSLTVSDDLNVVAGVVDQYGNVLKRGSIAFNLNGRDNVLNITDGTCVLKNSLLNQTHNVIVAMFNGIGYNSSTASAIVDIPKTNMDLSLNITKFLHDATISLESSNNINTSLIIKINDKNYPVIISNGKGCLNLTDLENDLYYVNVKCEELSPYQFDDLSDSFEINVKNTKFIFSNLVTFEGSGEFFNVTLTDENGEVLIDKELVIVLDNMTYFKNTDSNGNLSIPINLSNGEYLIDIAFAGDANYLPSNQSGNIKVRMNVGIDVAVNRNVNNVVVNVNLSKPINESLTVIVNDRRYFINSTEGVAYLELSGLSNGIYYFNVSLDDLNDYYCLPVSSDFTVDVKNTKIISSDFVTSEFSGDLFNITLVDEKGAVLADKELSIVLNNLTFIKTTDSYGNLSIPINLTYGEYSIDINFKGDNDYFASNQSANVKVKMNVDIDVSVNRSVNNAVVNVELSKQINETLTVIVSGKQHEVTSINGKALLKLYNLSNDIYKVTVSLEDKDNYNSLDANSTFVIDVKKTALISNDLTINDEDHVDFNVILTDENGVVLANKNISFILNGVSYDRITDENGVAFIPVNTVGGTYDVVVGFSGDNDYFASNTSNVIKVKTNVVLDVFVSITQNNAAIDINMSKGINESLSVIVNDKSYSVNSVDGNAFLELLNLSNEVYNVIVGLDDKDNYNSLDVGSTFVIDVKSSVIQSENLVICDDDDVKFNVTLTDENGILLTNKNITFVLNGITYDEVTDDYGVASVPLKLAMGEYDIAVAFAGDNEYFASSTNNVIKVKMDVVIGLAIGRSLNNVMIDINVSKPITEYLTLTVNDNPISVKLINGKASFELSNLSNGVYSVNVALNNDNYNSQDVNSTFLIDVKATQIQSGDLIVLDEDNVNFNVTLTDENGVLLNNKNITFVLNDINYVKVTDSNGVASIPVDLTMGIYDVSVAFAGDNDYFASNVSNVITVKTNVEISVSADISQNSAVINIDVSKSITDNLTVTVNEKSFMIPLINGKSILELFKLSNRKYKVTVGLDDNKYTYRAVNYNFIINVNENNSVPNEVVIVDDESTHFNLTIVDENDLILANTKVSILLGDAEYDLVSDDNGQVSVPLNMALGIHQIDIRFKDDTNQITSVISDIITIKTNVDIGYAIEEVYNNRVINVSLSKNINGTLEILVDKESYKIPITANSASIAVNDLDAGTHNVEIRLLEDSMYQFNNVSTQFNVSVKSTKLLVGDLITYYKSGQSFAVTLIDEYGNPLSGKEIHFRISNNLFFAKTDNFGQAAINISLIDGSYDIFVGFDGDNNYYESSNVSKIHVKSTIIADGILNKTYGSYYSFKLLDIDGKPLKKVSVEYILDNVKFAGVSDNDGIVSVQITKQPCNYTLIVYNPVNNESLSKTINALKRIVQNTDITIYAYSGSVYKVQVLDDNGNPEAAGKIVTFKINGNTYSKKTVDNGYVGLSLSLAAKQYSITASYNGFKVSNNVKVKPVLTAKNVVKKKAKSYKFSAKLVDKNGKALKGKKLTFKIKGKKYTAKTNKKGVATITIRLSLKVGSYKIYTNYGKSKITNTLKIKK